MSSEQFFEAYCTMGHTPKICLTGASTQRRVRLGGKEVRESGRPALPQATGATKAGPSFLRGAPRRRGTPSTSNLSPLRRC